MFLCTACFKLHTTLQFTVDYELYECYVRFTGARMLTCSKFPTGDPQILGFTIQNIVARANWRLRFVHFWIKELVFVLETYFFFFLHSEAGFLKLRWIQSSSGQNKAGERRSSHSSTLRAVPFTMVTQRSKRRRAHVATWSRIEIRHVISVGESEV